MYNHTEHILKLDEKPIYKTKTSLVDAILEYKIQKKELQPKKVNPDEYKAAFDKWYSLFTQVNKGINRTIDKSIIDPLTGALSKQLNNHKFAEKKVSDFLESYRSKKQNPVQITEYGKMFNDMLSTVLTAKSAIIITSDPIEGDPVPTSDLKYFIDQRVLDIIKSIKKEWKEKKQYMFLVPTEDVAHKLWNDFKELISNAIFNDAELLKYSSIRNHIANEKDCTFKNDLFKQICDENILKIYEVKTPIFTPKPYIVTDPNIQQNTASFIYAKKNNKNIEILKSDESEIRHWRNYTWNRLGHEISQRRIHEILPDYTEKIIDAEYIFQRFGLYKVA